SVDPAHEFMVATPKAGIYRKEVTVTSQNKQKKQTYHIIIERPFAFEDIVIQKFNNTLLVNNNPTNNGGYRFVKYQWYKNGQPISREQVYSVGDERNDLLDEEATYSVVVTTEDGDKIHTCPTTISFDRRIGIEVYPNPVARQSGLQVKVKYPGNNFPGAIARLYSLKGRQILTFRMKEKLEKMKLPAKITTGVYILVIEVNHHKKTTKIFVNH
ncbi:MAG TPA: T9SS type A sorting domain-containing protein, partial [Chitinophagaceae bacterium]|nr:T9SS type A sorting domain-containing protein [Chitinophagaceae bacterium]